MRSAPLLRRCAAVGALAFVTSGHAAPQAQEPVFSPDAIAAHVTFLADDLLEGRDTGSRGYEIAARYVASQFGALGLTPAGEQGWFQRIRFQSRQLADKKASVTIIGQAGERRWDNLTDVIIGASAIEAEQDVTAPLVFAGFGLDAPSLGFDDYKGLDVKGKIVVLLQGAPQGTNSEIGAHLSSLKAEMAAKRGAIGWVTIPTLARQKIRPWQRSVLAAGERRMIWLHPDGKPGVDAPGIRIADIEFNTPAAEALFAGAPASFAAVQAAADVPGGRPKGFPLKTRLRVQRSTEFETVSSPEVIGLVPGSDPKLKDEVVALTAHLDHVGVRPNPTGDEIYNGAMDNATGVATLLEVARAFANAPQRPRRSILFIAHAAEEKGLLGAAYAAQYPTIPIERISSLVNLDMPLLTYDFADVTAFGAEHSTMGPIVTAAAARMNVKISPDPSPAEGIFSRADHYPYVKRGVPSVFLMTGVAGPGKAAWDHFWNSNYHKPSDDLSQKIDWAVGAKFAKLNYLIALELANADARPLWYEGNFFGNTFAPTALKAPAPPSVGLSGKAF